MSDTLDAIREKYPAYADVPDEKLVTAIGEKYPIYLQQDPALKADFEKYAPKKAATLKGALNSFEQFAGSLPKMAAGVIEGSSPEIQKNKPDVWSGTPEEPYRRMSIMSDGRTVAEPPPSTDAYSLRARTPFEVIQATEANPLSKIGQTAQESVPLTPAEQRSKWTQAGQMIGGAAPMALGPLAVPAFIASSMGGTADDFHRIKQENPDLSDNDAADQALDLSMKKGAITAATFTMLPAPVRGALEKYLVNKMGADGFKRWIAGRAASSVETGTILGTQAAGQEVAEGKKPTMDSVKAAAGGVIMGALLPWLKKLPARPAAETPAPAATTAANGKLTPTSEPSTPTTESTTAAQKSTAPPKFQVLQTEEGKFEVVGPDNNPIGEPHDSMQSASAKAEELSGKPQGFQLPKEEQDMVDAERGSVPHQIDFVDPETLPEGEPFAKQKDVLGKSIGTIDRKSGRIIINPKIFSQWIKTIPGAQRGEAIRSLLNEEHIHLGVDDKSAIDYLKSLTPLERAIAGRRYHKDWRDMSEVDLGHEALRFRLQQLSRLKPREIAEASGKEKWMVQSLTALEHVIRGLRNKFGSGKSKAIVDRMAANLNVAKASASTSMPAAMSKEDEKLPKLVPGERWVTVTKPDGTTYQASFADKYYDHLVRGKVASVGKVKDGQISHGMLAPGETISESTPAARMKEEPKDPIASLSEAAAHYRASGDEESAVELEKMAKDLSQKMSEKSFPAARAKFKPVRPLTDEEKKALPPVPPEERNIILPPKPQGEFKLEGAKSSGEIKPPAGTRGEYRKPVQDKLTASLGLNTEYFRKSGSAAKPVPEGERTGAVEHGAPSAVLPTGKGIEAIASKWLGDQMKEFFSDLAEGRKGTPPKISKLERVINRMTGGRLQEGAITEIAQRVLDERLLNATGEELRLMLQSKISQRGRKPPAYLKGEALSQWMAKEGGSPTRRIPEIADAPSTPLEKTIAEGDLEFKTLLKSVGGGAARRSAEEARVKALAELRNKSQESRMARTLAGDETPAGKSSTKGVQASLPMDIEQEPKETLDAQARADLEKENQKTAATAEKRRAGVEATQDVAKIRARQSRRGGVQNTLRRWLSRDLMKEKKVALERTSVTPEEIREGRSENISNWQPFSPSAEKTPEALAMNLVDEAGVSGDVPKTVTRRVTAIKGRSSGKVFLVSTYEERGLVGEKKTMQDAVRLLDPDSGSSKLHSSLRSILKRYRILYSGKLDEPVQNFKQSMTDEEWKGFEKKANDYAGREPTGDEPIEGTEGIKTSSFRGPHVKEAGVMGAGELERGLFKPLTDNEATALQNYFVDFLGDEPKSVDEVDKAIAGASQNATPAAIVALAKILKAVQRENPKLSVDELKDKAANIIFLDKDLKTTIRKSQAMDLRDEPNLNIKRPPIQRDSPDPELPPTVIDPEMAEAYRNITQEKPDKTSSELAEEGAKKKADYNTWQGAMKVLQKLYGEGDESMPAARMKFAPVQEKAQDATVRVGRAIQSAVKKTDQTDAISASLDAAENSANNSGRESGTAVRMEANNNKQTLSAANAVVASGAIKADYKMNAPAQAEAVKLKAASPGYKEGQRLMQSQNPQEVVNGMKMVSDAMARDVHKPLLEQGLISHTDATYTFDDSQKHRLDEFLTRVNSGIEKADALIKSGSWWDKMKGRSWKKGAEALKSELEFAKAQWNNPELRATALQMRKELNNQYDFENYNGYNSKYDESYLPGRYDGEFFTDNGVLFGGTRVLGRQWRAPKVFQTYYHAIEQGPYIALTRDGSVIVEHRVRQGMNKVNRGLWVESLYGYKDPVSGKPMVVSAKRNKLGSKVPFSTPSADYELVKPDGSGRPVAVLAGADARLIRQLTSPSAFKESALLADALAVSQWLKHTVLLGDFFHLFRVGYYSASIAGRNARMKPGWAALDFRESDIPRAVEKGLISQKTADYLNEKIAFNNGGKAQMISRIRLSKLFTQSGINVGRISDAIYMDLVRNVPGFGRYNKFLFDKFTRGMMTNSAVNEFERISKSNPGEDSAVVMRKIAKDLNYYYGSIGRQGWVKSATVQDAARMFLLAPQWLEGLVKKEVSPVRWALSGGKEHGTAARGIARGLVSMFVLTQVANLITRRQPTWDNKEKDHKWDADIFGVWVSPMSVFNELTHDLIRLNETKPKVWDAIKQVGENKLGFYGRVGVVLATDRSPSGEFITTTPGIVKAAAEQLLPVPISFGKAAQSLASVVTKGKVPPLEPGQVWRQTLATIGIKGQVGSQPIDDIQRQAGRFAQQNGLRSDAVDLVPTDQPSYAKLRHELFIGNEKGAQSMLQQILKTHTPHQVSLAMHEWSRRPFTGSRKGERLFIDSLDDDGRELYTKAQQQRMDVYNKWVDFYTSQR